VEPERGRVDHERGRVDHERGRVDHERGRVDHHRARRILARVRETPPGFVRTYGDVSPGAPRVAGAVLHACEDRTVPWHRIVRADGSLAKGERQRQLLEREGVPFRSDRVDMAVARLPT
jgi:alkylated DNA nucleotide flippase Atl1